DGSRLGAEGLHRRRGRRHGQSRRLDRGGDLLQYPGILRLDLGQPVASGDRLLRRPDLHAVVPADRPVRVDAPMSKRDTLIYWSGFSVIMALLIGAPLVLPPFWQRFLTEILIW